MGFSDSLRFEGDEFGQRDHVSCAGDKISQVLQCGDTKFFGGLDDGQIGILHPCSPLVYYSKVKDLPTARVASQTLTSRRFIWAVEHLRPAGMSRETVAWLHTATVRKRLSAMR